MKTMTTWQHLIVATLFILGMLFSMCAFSLSDTLTDKQWYSGFFGFGIASAICFSLMAIAYKKYTNQIKE